MVSINSEPSGAVTSRAHYLTLFVTFVAVGFAYFALGRIGLTLASINPSASPIWPPTGFAIAAMLLWGYGVAPAVFLAAFAVNVTTSVSIEIALAIAAGNMLEGLVGAMLINRWAGGRDAFASPISIAKFALVSLAIATPISATIGVASLALGGFVDRQAIWTVWLTWWLGDFAGAVVIAPVVVLWAKGGARSSRRGGWPETAAVFAAACGFGLIAFNPFVVQPTSWDALGFLIIIPLLWTALRCGQRETAAVALILTCFAIWGTLTGGGPFARSNLNDSFLILLMFMIGASLPSLALSAEVAMRRQTEEFLRDTHAELDRRVQQRTTELAEANRNLQAEIDQRRQAEAELEQQSVHLLEAQRLANLGSFVWDVPNNRLAWSQQLMNIYGLRPGEFRGTAEDFFGRVHDEDRQRVRGEIERAFASGRGFQFSERIVRPNGDVRRLASSGEVIKDEQGQVVRVLGVCQDVTDRLDTQDALRQSQENYRILINGIRDYAIFMLDPQGNISSWNIAAQRIKQYSEGEIVGKHHSQFYTEEDCKRGEPDRALRTAAKEDKYEAEGWRVRKDGTLFWAHVMLNAIRNEQGDLVGFAKITRDMTERRETQAALDEAREQLAQAQKMEALGQLTGGIAHDFNNLLMIIAGHTQILSRRLADPELKIPQSLDAIEVAAKRGANLTRQLLSFSRRQRLNPEVINLRDRIEAITGMVGSSLRGNIAFSTDIAPDIWRIEVDISELELALLNIAVNARDAMPDGGAFTLTARNIQLDPASNEVRLNGEFVELAMTDTGAGVPPELLSKIFEPFFTTKQVGKGTGLGLSQVYGFARQSGGAVAMTSEVGRGTTVRVWLPRSHKELPAATEQEEAQINVGRMGTVLVVEDNAEVADVTASLLRQLGFGALRAENAADALARLQNGEQVRLVLSDVVMPGGMNGIDLADEIRRRYPDMPILLTSGYSDAAQTANARFVILRKPFNLAVLDRAIHECLGRERPA